MSRTSAPESPVVVPGPRLVVQDGARGAVDGVAEPGGLFASSAFHDLHAERGSVYLRWQVGEEVRGTVHGGPVAPGRWRSPLRGTYGGFALVPGLGPEELELFVERVEETLRARGALSVEVALAPAAHDPERFSETVYVLVRRGWVVSTCEIDQAIPVDDVPLESKLSRGNAKRLRKCARAGIVTELVDGSELGVVHETLLANRTAKGRGLSMDLAAMTAMRDRFPSETVLFLSRDGRETAAAAFCLRVETDVLYVFAWGHRPGYETLSPVVSLADAAYRYCRDQGLRLLDLGTFPVVDGHPDHGLRRFKQGLGGRESLKLCLRKDWS